MARFIYPAGGGGSASADIADFIFTNENENNSKMTLPINKEMTIETTRDDDSDCDININSADDIFINAYGDDVVIAAFNEVRIGSNDGQYEWRFADTGCLELPGNGEICNPINSSGDGLGYSTISINPDINTNDDRYIIIDPTAPNHIHIRGGGTQDASSAQLFLGGEQANVSIWDGAHEVYVQSYNSDSDYYYNWTFDNTGYLYGPSEGGLIVSGISNPSNLDNLFITSNYKVYLDGTDGEFLNDPTVPSNQIATIGDIANTVSDVTPYSPVWSGTDLAFTGTSASGYYVKVGSVVTVQIDVEFDNVTNFGSGQYSLTLPIASRYHTDVYGGSLHKVSGTTDHYSLKGHLSPSSTTMTIWSLKSSAQDEPFDYNSPVVLTTADKFHMSFTYICE